MNRTKGLYCEFPTCSSESEFLCHCNSTCSYFCHVHLNSHLEIDAPEHAFGPPEILESRLSALILSQIPDRNRILKDLETRLLSVSNSLISYISDHISVSLSKIRTLKQDLSNYTSYIRDHSGIFSELLPELSWEDSSAAITQNLNIENLKKSIEKFYNKDFTLPEFSNCVETQTSGSPVVDFRLSLQSISIRTKLRILAMSQIVIPGTQDPSAILYSPRTSIVITGNRQGELQIFYPFLQQDPVPLLISNRAVHCISESSDSNYVIVGLNGELSIIRLSTNSLVHTQEGVGSITEICTARDPSVFVTSNYEGILRCWKIVDDEIRPVWEVAHNGPTIFQKILCLAISDDDCCTVSGDYEGNVKVLRTGDGGLIRDAARIHGDKVKCLALCRDSQRAITVGDNNLMHIWNLRTGTIFWSINNANDPIICVNNSLNGEILIARGRRNTIMAWNLASRQQVLMIPQG